MTTIDSPARSDVPFVDLWSLNSVHEEEFVGALRRVLATSDFGCGSEVEAFEGALAAAVGTQHAVGVNSGTAALQLMLLGLGIGPGDEVVIPANTFFATAEAVVAAGAVPILADPDLETALVSAEAIDAACGPRTAAIIGVHLFGQPVDVAGYRDVADRRGLAFLEDAAQAIGASSVDARAGSFGRGAAFSFYPAKNLGALGQGGAVTTDDPELARQVRMLRSHGELERYTHHRMGFNERLDGLQAAFLSVKLPYVEADLQRRELAVARYDEAVAEMRGCRRLTVRADVRSAHHLYVVRVDDRDRVRDEMSRDGIATGVHYPVPIHLQPAWAECGRGAGTSFPNADRLAGEMVSLPLFAGITTEQTSRTVESLSAALAGRADTTKRA